MNLSLTEFAWNLVPKVAGSLSVSHDSLSLWERIQPPVDFSTNGHLIEWLFKYTTSVNIFWFTMVCLGLFGFSFLYSAKRHKKPLYTHGTEKKHYLITAGIGVLVFMSVDMVITKISARDMKETFWKFPTEQEDIVKVQILAQQWMWNVRYAGADGEFNTADDVVTINDLRVPTGKKIMIQLTSKDVIHSFYLPNARIKADAIPGRMAKLWFDANIPGIYEIACAEMCGTHHYLMAGKLTVYSPEDYERWKKESEAMALATNDKENPDIRWGWKWGNF